MLLVVDTVFTLPWSADSDGSAGFLDQRWLDYGRDLLAAIQKGNWYRNLP
jgi:hypothetical protein